MFEFKEVAKPDRTEVDVEEAAVDLFGSHVVASEKSDDEDAAWSSLGYSDRRGRLPNHVRGHGGLTTGRTSGTLQRFYSRGEFLGRVKLSQ